MKTQKLATLCITCLLLFMPIAALAQPYVISTDGQEVTDQKTGLIWRRCAEGMTYITGTCTGTALTYTHEAALVQAKTVSVSGGWRLPNVKELSSIADKSLSNPAIDPLAFPATPVNYFWSSSPYVGNPANAWFVNFGSGDVLSFNRGSGLYVRLVRAGQ